MLSRLPIRASAPLLVGIPVLLVGLLLTLLWYRQSQHAISELAHQNINQIHELASTKVADVLSIPVRMCEVNAQLVRSGVLNPADLHAWRETLYQQARSFDMLSAISWGAADGRTAWISRYADGRYYWAVKDDPDARQMLEFRLDADGAIPEEPSSTFDFNLFSRPWFQTPRDVAQPTWSAPFVWVGGGKNAETILGIAYGIPLYDPHKALVGVIDADFSLNDLSQFLGTVKIGATGVAALMTADGQLLATSNGSAVVNAAGERIHAADAADSMIAAASPLIADAGATAMRADLMLDGDVHYLHASSIGREVGLNWTLATIVPERDFLAKTEAEFRRSGMISMIAVLASVILGLAAARWLVKPLATLVTAVRRIGQGDLDTQVQIHHAPEYTNLAAAINLMTIDLQDRMRMRESLSLAMEVQRNLLPSADPKITGLDISGHSTYCDETGGDYYDFLEVSGIDDETVVIAVGDVMGHGVAAAMLMATARGILRSRCAVPGSLADFLHHLNTMLVPDTRGKRFMTMLLVTLNARQQEMRWASAGHGPPIVYDSSSDTFLELDGGGLPLGIVSSEDYEEYLETCAKPGHIILAATDGLWETKGEDGKLFGMDRLRALIRDTARQPAPAISQAIRDTLARYRGPAAPDDDLTFIVLKVL